MAQLIEAGDSSGKKPPLGCLGRSREDFAPLANEPSAHVACSNEAIVRRDGDGEKVGIGREGGERIPGFEVPELERLVGARRPSGSAATAIPRPRWPAQKASYFEGVVTLLKIGCGFVGIRCYNHAAATTSRRSMECGSARSLATLSGWRIIE